MNRSCSQVRSYEWNEKVIIGSVVWVIPKILKHFSVLFFNVSWCSNSRFPLILSHYRGYLLVWCWARIDFCFWDLWSEYGCSWNTTGRVDQFILYIHYSLTILSLQQIMIDSGLQFCPDVLECCEFYKLFKRLVSCLVCMVLHWDHSVSFSSVRHRYSFYQLSGSLLLQRFSFDYPLCEH